MTEQPDENVWHDWLTRADETGRVSVVDRETQGAREAVHTCVSSTAARHCRRAALGCGSGPRPAAPTSCASRPHGGDARSSATSPTARADHSPSRSHRSSRTFAHVQASDQRPELMLVAPVPAWWSEEGLSSPRTSANRVSRQQFNATPISTILSLSTPRGSASRPVRRPSCQPVPGRSGWSAGSCSGRSPLRRDRPG